MKYKIVLFTFFVLYISTLSAQTEQILSHTLSWKGVDKWYSDSSSINVISFDGAHYPFENRLPYFQQRMPCDMTLSYSVMLINPVYIPLTPAETTLISGNVTFTSETQVLTNILNTRGSSFLDIGVLPFVMLDGKIMKLQSFSLQINTTKKPENAKAISSHSYATTSVLDQGKFIKIRIINSGVYKLTYEDLVSMGISPVNVRIFGYGGNVLDQDFSQPKIDDLPELAIYMNKGSDGVFNAGDYILFYAQGINKWTYDISRSMFTHTLNSFSQYGYYFVTSDVGTGRKIEVNSTVLPDSLTINSVSEFTDYQVYEKELVNLALSGKVFYGETFNGNSSLTLPFNFPNAVLSNTTKVRFDVAASSANPSYFSLNLNGSQQNILSVASRTQDNYTMAMGSAGLYTLAPQSDNLNFSIAYSMPTSTSVGYLNFLEVNVRRQLKMSGSVMQFQNIDYLGKSVYSKYQISNATSNLQVWDITDPQNISLMTTSLDNGILTFVASSTDFHSYIAIDPMASASFSKPETVGVVPNQNLHGITQADMVIITHPNFLTQAQTLAQAHRVKDNLTVEVVTTDQVYNEFSSGTPDATAYRWLMKMLYDRVLITGVSSNLPKYLLLFGRGSYDNRNIRSDSGNNNLILTFQADNSLVITSSYVTDDYYALLDDNEGSNVSAGLMDIGVGRFSVNSVQQATDVVNKTISYMNNLDKGKWKNQLCFLADDGGNGDGNIHMSQANLVATSIANAFPAYQINKIYLDAYVQEISASGESYPAAKIRFMNLLNSGLFLLDFTGHAGPTQLTNEAILTLDDVKNLLNQHLPLFVAATCDFSQFDVPTFSGGEEVVLNPVGGGIGILSGARPVYSSQNYPLNKSINDNLFTKQNGSEMRIGDVIANAKNSLGAEINKLSYIYLGDPAVKLNYPTKYQVITSKINENTTFGNDTLKALSVDTIKGFVADESGNKVTNFNGTLQIVIYDKVQQIITLNNHNEPILTSLHGQDSVFFQYPDRPNILFSGNAEVKNGEYSFSFMLPKDIKYNYGGGRINYYAEDDTNDFEAQGYFENFIVGGSVQNLSQDTVGPSVKLFLNSTNFVSGDKVNETPLFIADISDINGINTVGSGIGHDILMTIDQDPTQSYVLNDYFQSSPNSYTDGVVTYKMSELANGKHSLTFRVWDLLNNSSTSTINFEVVKGLAPVIFSVYNYPNPVKDQTNIVVIHDRPETILNTTVEVFDLTGRKIWSFSQASAGNVSWDLIGNNGQHVKAGIYLYKVSVKTTDTNVTTKANKMLIVE